MRIKVYTIDVKLPGWLRRTLVIGVVPAVLLGICAIVYATAVTGQPDFVAGEPLSSSSLNAHFGALQTQIDTANGRVSTIQQTALVPNAYGKVGIGTVNPNDKLEVNGGRIRIVSANEPYALGLVYGDAMRGIWLGGTSDEALAFSSWGGGETMRLTQSGKMGIGTPTPVGKFDVVGGRSYFSAGSEAFAVGARYVSTGGAVFFGATNGTETPDAQISAATGQVLMTLLNGGNVGIKTTIPQYALDVTGTIRGDNVTPSDRSLKKNIEPLPTDTLNRVCKINGVSFEWDRQKLKESFSRESSSSASTNAPEVDGFPKTTQIGLIAQDVEKVFPSLVETDGKGVKSIHYMGVTAVLLEAVKTQQKQIEELKARVRALEEPRSGARAARVRPVQRSVQRNTVGLGELVPHASGA